MINESTVLSKNPEMPSRKYLKSIIIEPGITLNEMASDIYNHIDGKMSIHDICSKIVNEYDVDYQTCLEDCMELFEMLIEHEAIKVKQGA
ncbi:PqqD family protein [Bacillus cabrialesii]|uniref:PqqD family protein n=1 Tax=Bacillus cabrialesii TaxID=2487276 RepID=UPI001C05B97F|nr:PqqD family protein [Bacillus cabrialesii]MBU2659401.1 PqqD family protein [Bacillus cabrialesii]